MSNGRIRSDELATPTSEQRKNSALARKLYKKEITLEEAIKQGYKEPEDDLFGMSQLMRDDLDERG